MTAMLTKDGLELDDPEIIGKIAKSKMSPSTVSGLLQCPARFIAAKYVVKDLIPQDPLGANVLGTTFHKVMEYYFMLPKGKRTTQTLRMALAKTLRDDEFALVRDDDQAVERVKDMVRGFYRLNTHPETVDVATIKNDWGYDKRGLELYVQADLEDGMRPVMGFIDRLRVGERGLIIDDWKTGAKVKDYDPSSRFPDFDYVRQQTLYTMILEKMGHEVESANLIYPVARWLDGSGEHTGKVTPLPVHDKKIRSKALDDARKASMMLDSSVENNRYECSPSPLCSWCPLVNVCPASLKINKENAVESRAKQPAPDVFSGRVAWRSTKPVE